VFLGDPMEAALGLGTDWPPGRVEMARTAIAEFPPVRRLNEIPFDADRMRHSVVCEMPDGAVLYYKGAPESVLPRCRQVLHGGHTEPLDTRLREMIVDAQEAMAEKGLRILLLQ
jgi:sodium/potassium-transporting ATPase subunit alpha